MIGDARIASAKIWNADAIIVSSNVAGNTTRGAADGGGEHQPPHRRRPREERHPECTATEQHTHGAARADTVGQPSGQR
jgi:hypothetical protein